MRSDATQVCFFLDHLGLIVRNKLVDGASIYSILGRLIQRTWEKLSPFIEAGPERVEPASKVPIRHRGRLTLAAAVPVWNGYWR